VTCPANRARWGAAAAVAWCAGWLWAGGVVVIAAGALLAWLVGWSPLGRWPGVWLAAMAAVGLAAVLAGAALGGR
jgi:hypothetical protein